ncbi:MAG: hypothetical protein IJS39_17780 [Synergistaceae bacterium]|nr:hypothetical protein [Synergistaceae bacterium]
MLTCTVCSSGRTNHEGSARKIKSFINIYESLHRILNIAAEYTVQKAVNQAMTGRTSFIIAHRLNAIHEELLRSGGLYADLYRMQFGQD